MILEQYVQPVDFVGVTQNDNIVFKNKKKRKRKAPLKE